MDDDTQTRLVERIEYLSAVRSARERLPEVAGVIMAAHGDAEALSGIRSVLRCSEIAASAVYHMQLRRLRKQPEDLLSAEIAELERQLEDRGHGD